MVSWKRQICQFKWVLYLSVGLDINGISLLFSKQAQSDSLNIMDVPTIIEEMTERLEKCKKGNFFIFIFAVDAVTCVLLLFYGCYY